MSKALLKSTSLVSFITFLSRVLGFMRENVFAVVFGATGDMDAFIIAFRIPNFLRKLFAEGAFSQAFVPVLQEVKSHHNEAELKEFLAKVFGTLGGVLLLVSVIGILITPLWTSLFAPGFHKDPHKFAMANDMLMIMFPYIFFVSLTALAGAIFNCYNKFFIFAMTPLVLSLCMGWSAVYLAPHFQAPIEAAAWGVLIAGVLQLALQVPFLYKMNLLVWPKWGWQHVLVKRIMRLMLPALFGISISQLSLLLDTVFASFLKTGSVAWLYYADRLMQFPLGVFGVALASVVLPHLSKQHASNNLTDFKRALDYSLRLIVLIALPSSLGLAVLAGPILVTLFEYGKFNSFDVVMTERALWAFSIGLFFFIAVKVAVAGFYSRQDTKTPVRIGIIAVIVNMVLNTLLIFPLKHVGLALATSIAAGVNTIWLFVILRKQGVLVFHEGWGKVIKGALFGNAVMATLMILFQGNLSVWQLAGAPVRGFHLLTLVLIGMGSYFACLYLCGIRKRDLFF